MALTEQFAETHSSLQATFESQRWAARRDGPPSYEVRRDRLDKLQAILERYEDELVAAMAADFGHRSPHESRLLDVVTAIGDIKEIRRRLKTWMKPRRVPTRLHLRPGHSRVIPQPLGVVGIISPWNFPVYLAFSGMSAAIAAGNRVMVKPSEITPRTSAVMAKAIAERFEPTEMTVIQGGADVGREFSSLPFDHLLFTGSTAVGRQVARAAAENLTPVTLELGGKSPAVVAPSADLDAAAERIVYGKMLNAGQICVSPDYALVPLDRVDAFVAAAERIARRLYPTLATNPDYTSIVTDRHFARLQALIEGARSHAVRVVQVNPAGETLSADRRKIPLTLVVGPDDGAEIMKEEIFGPILPIVAYDRLDEAIAFVNGRDRPLALYVFAQSADERDRVLGDTMSGGVTVNDTLWHVACDTLPFGGVGASGMGAYHGQAGFDTFSKLKPVFYQSRINGIRLFYPPYGRIIEVLGKVLRKIM